MTGIHVHGTWRLERVRSLEEVQVAVQATSGQITLRESGSHLQMAASL